MHLTQFQPVCCLSAKNYQNWWKFDEVLTQTILHSFLRHSVVIKRFSIKHSSFKGILVHFRLKTYMTSVVELRLLITVCAQLPCWFGHTWYAVH